MQPAGREIFWQIGEIRVFYGLALLAVLVFLLGLFGRVRFIRRGAPVRFAGWVREKGWAATLWEVVTHRSSRENPRARGWHLLVFCGWWMLTAVTLWVMMADRAWPELFVGAGYRCVSLLAEAGGVCLFLGACLALVSVPHGMSTGRRAERTAVFISLIVLALTGFLLEGVRARLHGDPYPAWSPVGAGVSLLMGATESDAWAPRVFPWLWWAHSLLGLAFVAWIPFSRSLRHLLFLPLHRARQPVDPRVPLPEVDLEPAGENACAVSGPTVRLGIETAGDTTPRQRLAVLSCMDCGRCDAVCPAFQTGQPLSPRALLGAFRDHVLRADAGGIVHSTCDQEHAAVPARDALGAPGVRVGRAVRRVMDDLDPDALWACRTCLACEEVCPAGIGHVSQILELRRAQVLHHGRLPSDAAGTLRNLARTGNPYGTGPEERRAWIRRHAQGEVASGKRHERVLWIGCFPPGDTQKPRVLDCLVALLNQAGVGFSLPAESVSCCGEPARVLGDEDLFRRQAERLAGWIRETGVREILVHCPHCHHVLNELCDTIRPTVVVLHTGEVFRELIQQGRLVTTAGGFRGSLTYHDPCFLGRYHGRYAAVREVLYSICGGVEGLLEPENTRERSFCCGSGGGHFFMDLDRGERPASRRVREWIACGADTAAVSCPFCLSTLEDACRRLVEEPGPRVADWLELLRESIQAP